LLLIEPERVRVIEGNYSTYQMLLGRNLEQDADSAESGRSEHPKNKPAPKVEKPTKPEKSGKSEKSKRESAKKRRFPFRKIRDIEDEIFERETCVEEMQKELLEPQVLRDGNRIREIKQRIDDEQAAIKTLYEHWEEASEMNW